MFGVVPKTIWNKTNPADSNNLCSWAMRCLLVEEGDRLILIDTGIGNKQDEKFFSHYYLHGEDTLDGSLAKQGFHRDDITDVLLTHLHFDHCGGSIIRENDRLTPAFQNAVYWSNERHWEWATRPNEREKASFLKENILPIKESGQLRFIPEAAAGAPGPSSIVPGLSIRYVYGHTDAMMLPQLQYKGRTIVFMADLLPSTGHLPVPYVMAYDMFPLKTLQEKKSFLEESLRENTILFFEHDPETECCDLQMTEKGIRPGRSFKLSELK